MQQPRVLHAAIVPGQVNLSWRSARGRGRLGGQIQMVQNRDDAQDAQRAPTSWALRNVRRKDPQQRKAERLQEGLGLYSTRFGFGFWLPATDSSGNVRLVTLGTDAP